MNSLRKPRQGRDRGLSSLDLFVSSNLALLRITKLPTETGLHMLDHQGPVLLLSGSPRRSSYSPSTQLNST
jgi:hypothetical protein